MNPLTWQNPGQLFVAQDVIKVNIYSVAELRMNKRTLSFLGMVAAFAATVSAQTLDFTAMKNEINEKSLPLVNVTVEIDKVNKPEYTPAKIEIVDPQKRTDGNVETTFNCKVKYRGASSLRYDKKSFAVKLLNEKGKSLDAPVLGIRKDDAWILDAMAVDRLRMRNRLNFDVWNAMSSTPYTTDTDNRNGTKGYFVELFINGEYHGLYCMTDKVNRKLLGVKKPDDKDKANVKINGVVYKCESWGESAILRGYDEQSMDGELWNNWSLDYPDDYPCADSYMPLKNFIDYCAYSSDEEFADGVDKRFYLQNIIDYHVFLLSQGLRDNNMKNTFLSIVDKNKSDCMMLTPWDLDCSLGGNWDGQYYNNLAANNEVIENKLYNRLWNDNVADYRNRVADTWRKWGKDGILSKTGFNECVDNYVEALTVSGAWQREYAKWNGNPVELKRDLDEEAGYVKDWYSRNYDNLGKTVFYNLGTTGITNIVVDENKKTDVGDNTFYNIMGQKVGNGYHGIVVVKGKKQLMLKR